MTNEEQWINFTARVLKESMRRCGDMMMAQDAYTGTQAGIVIALAIERFTNECREQL